MSTIEIKQVLTKIISNGDADFVRKIYDMVLQYQTAIEQEKMILEAEEDIKDGNVFTSEEVKKMFDIE